MSKSTGGFGASLDQLATVLTAGADKRRFFNAPVGAVHPDPDQPRTEFGGEDDASLAQSIRQSGIVQPLVVRPHPELPQQYFIVAGERRWRAAQAADLAEVPVVLRDQLSPSEILVLQLIENDQRRPLGPLDTGKAIQRLIESTGWTQTEVGERLGRSAAWVSKHLALLEETGATARALESGALKSVETARLFRDLPDEAQEDLLAQSSAENAPIGRGAVERALKLVPRDKKPAPAGAPAAPRRGRPRKAPPAAPDVALAARFPVELTWAQLLTLFSRLDAGPPTPDTYASRLRDLLKT